MLPAYRRAKIVAVPKATKFHTCRSTLHEREVKNPPRTNTPLTPHFLSVNLFDFRFYRVFPFFFHRVLCNSPLPGYYPSLLAHGVYTDHLVGGYTVAEDQFLSLFVFFFFGSPSDVESVLLSDTPRCSVPPPCAAHRYTTVTRRPQTLSISLMHIIFPHCFPHTSCFAVDSKTRGKNRVGMALDSSAKWRHACRTAAVFLERLSLVLRFSRTASLRPLFCSLFYSLVL